MDRSTVALQVYAGVLAVCADVFLLPAGPQLRAKLSHGHARASPSQRPLPPRHASTVPRVHSREPVGAHTGGRWLGLNTVHVFAAMCSASGIGLANAFRVLCVLYAARCC
jgi:hypothetical protein